MEPQAVMTLEALGLALLAVVYFVIAVFRAAYAEVSPMSAARLLSASGLGPREGESPSDMPPVMRTTFDLVHHLVLIACAGLVFHALARAEAGHPFLLGAAGLVTGMVAIQVLARALALRSPERAFSASLGGISLLYTALRPIATPVAWTVRRMRQAGRDRRAAEGVEEATDEQIEAFIDAGQQEGILEAEAGQLIRQVVEFHDSVVREAMTPRTQVVALRKGATVAQAREVFARERHSRLPVYRDHLDNVEGVVMLKDLVASWGRLPEDAPVDSLMLPAHFVPETKQVSELLKEMQARRIHMAIVVDEYGGTAGVVSIEDLLEELVGDIQEEHEQEEKPLVREGDGTYLALGTASLDDLRAALSVELEAEGVETIAGLIFSHLGRIPSQGEVVEANGLRLEVVEADTRKIRRVRVTRPVGSPAR